MTCRKSIPAQHVPVKCDNQGESGVATVIANPNDCPPATVTTSPGIKKSKDLKLPLLISEPSKLTNYPVPLVSSDPAP